MLQIYNTFTHQKETFKPITAGHISLYVCGITVYDYCHLGHARVFVAFDVIVRFLRASGWKVNFIRNITDIDDKIIQRASQNMESIDALTARFIEAMNQDAKALNVIAPNEEPRATAHIDKIIAMVEKLVKNHVAYIAQNGDVYFEVAKYNNYGQLAKKDLDQLQAGARVEIVDEKRSPLDFVLWKRAKPNEPHYASPWGEGRPGWHIECSAMSTACLGETFDLHGGGADLIFPHHENERAQSECATGKPFANTWMHVGFVQIDKEKMSKSLNNFFTIRDILAEHNAEVIRYFLISSHYRSPVNFSNEQLLQANNALTRLYNALRGVDLTHAHIPSNDDVFSTRFFAAMNDDFNTPVALSVLFDCAHALNTAREKNDPNYIAYAAILKKLGNILGMLEENPDDYLQGKATDTHIIEQLIQEREQARKAKNWSKADEIRQKLTSMNILIDDTAAGTLWRKGS